MASKKVRRKQWEDENMVKAVADKKMTINAAATKFSVLHKTLDDRIKGRVQHGSTPGVDTVLTAVEEAGLESYLLHMAGCGFPLTRPMVKAFAWAIAKRSGRSNRFNPEYGPGNHWWSLFKQRHPSLALHKSDNLERSRAEALNPAIVSEYFDLLRTTLEKNGLLTTPRQLYNCDETFYR